MQSAFDSTIADELPVQHPQFKLFCLNVLHEAAKKLEAWWEFDDDDDAEADVLHKFLVQLEQHPSLSQSHKDLVPSPTSRLYFRTWSDRDAELAMQLWGDVRVTALIDARGQLTQSQVITRLQQEIETQCQKGIQYWPMFSRADNTFIGCAGLRPHSGDKGLYVEEAGFHLVPERWGKGIGYEAASAVIKHAFAIRSVDAVFAGHNPKNEASRRLLTKLGFEPQGESFYEPTGLMHPSYLLFSSEHDSTAKIN